MTKKHSLLVAAAALAAIAWVRTGATPSSATHIPVTEVAIDVDMAGNEAKLLGPTESCDAEPLQLGQTIEVDVVVRGVPEPTAPFRDGIIAYEMDFLFDPAVLSVEKVLGFDGPTLIGADGQVDPFFVVDYDGDASVGTNQDPPPGTSGAVRIDAVDLSPNLESGDGVLTRISLRAVGRGVSVLRLTDHLGAGDIPGLLDGESRFYAISEVTEGAVVVGSGSCPDPVPTVTPSETSAQTAVPTPSAAAPTPSPQSTTPGLVIPAAFPTTGGVAERQAGESVLAIAGGIALALSAAAFGAARRRV